MYKFRELVPDTACWPTEPVESTRSGPYRRRRVFGRIRTCSLCCYRYWTALWKKSGAPTRISLSGLLQGTATPMCTNRPGCSIARLFSRSFLWKWARHLALSVQLGLSWQLASRQHRSRCALFLFPFFGCFFLRGGSIKHYELTKSL